MVSLTAPVPVVKVSEPVNGRRAVLVEVRGRKVGYYLVPVDPGFHAHGRAFRLEKFATDPGTDAEAGAYHVVVVPAGAGHHSCECKGFYRHGHCKHVAALLTLCLAGKL
jgi:hypothetical protein